MGQRTPLGFGAPCGKSFIRNCTDPLNRRYMAPGASPYSPKFSQFHAVFQRIWQNHMLAPSSRGSWRPLLQGILDPPLHWNHNTIFSLSRALAIHGGVCKISLSFRFRISLSDMTNYKSAFGKVCRIKNRQTFKSMPILNSAYHAVKYAELRIGILLKVCRFVIRHITTWYGMPN